MPIAFDNPLILMLLVALPAFFLLGRERLSLFSPWRRRGILAARLLSVAAVILALAGPAMRLDDATMSVAFSLDNSDSISPDARAQQEDWVRQAISSMRGGDRAAVVRFGGDAQVAKPLGSDKEYQLAPRGDVKAGTDVGAALRLSSGLLPSSGLRRVVIMSDGWDTAGKVEEAKRSLPAGTEVDVVPMPAMADRPEVLMESLDVPSYLREGDSFDVNAVIGSSHEGPAKLQLLVDGQQSSASDVQLGQGANLVTMFQKALPAGFHSIQMSVNAGEDTAESNNWASSFVVVKGKGSILVVEGHANAGQRLQQQLQGSGLNVDRIVAGQLPIQISSLLRYDSVVLDDVPGPSLSLDQFKTLESYVKDQGRGLMTVGGQSSYGLGDYLSSPLENMLPVSSDVPIQRDRGDIALVLVVDRSGSMDETNGGASKMEMAKQAAIQATKVLKPGDQLGVIAFDTEVQWVVPMQKVGNNLDDIRASIAKIRSSGGTDIYGALQSAYNAVKDVQATRKHITIMTDGQSWKGPYQTMIERMRPYQITLSTIGIGEDADAQWLAELAQLGDGRFYFTQRYSDVPRIVYQEVSAATRAAEVDGKVTPQFVSPSPILRGLDKGSFPTLNGYVATKPKDAASIILKSDRGDPILAQWQYGLGRVVSWTSDMQGLWTQDWFAQPQAAKIWDQAVRWTMAPPIDRSLQLSAGVDGTQATVTAQSIDGNGSFIDLADTKAVVRAPDGSKTALLLKQTAPGQYQATLPVSTPGLYRVDVAQQRQGASQASEITGFSVPGSSELRMLGSNDPLLKELSAATGGRVLDSPAEAFSRAGMPPASGWEPLWPYLLGLSLLLLPLEVALRRIRGMPFSIPRRRPAHVVEEEEQSAA